MCLMCWFWIEIGVSFDGEFYCIFGVDVVFCIVVWFDCLYLLIYFGGVLVVVEVVLVIEVDV